MKTIKSKLGITDISTDRRLDYLEVLNQLHENYGEFGEMIKEAFPLDNLDDFISKICDVAFLTIERVLAKKGHRPGSFRMLKAHGNSDNEWRYFEKENDSETSFPVQDWIDAHDGNYSVLVVSSCNIGRKRPKSKKSILVYPLGLGGEKNLIPLFTGEESNFEISEPS